MRAIDNNSLVQSALELIPLFHNLADVRFLLAHLEEKVMVNTTCTLCSVHIGGHKGFANLFFGLVQ